MKMGESPTIIALHLPSTHPPNFISATDHYIVAATSTNITCFQLEPPQALAHWKAPPQYTITALKLSPDSKALATVVHRPRDSALVLLDPQSLSRLFRITLPSFTSNPSISFVSPPLPTKPLTKSLLPTHLVSAFEDIHRAQTASQLPRTPTAQFALALSPTCPSKTPIILVFHKRYRRLHHLTTLAQPRPLTLLSVPNLAARSPELVFFDAQSVHHMSPLGSHQIKSTFPIRTVLATVHSHQSCFAIAAIVEHPTNRTCVAVFRENSTTLIPIHTNPLPNVAVLASSNRNQFFLGTVTATGVVVVAELLLRPFVIIDVVPRANAHVPSAAQQLHLCIPPTPFTPLSVIVNNGIVMCRYAAKEADLIT